MYLEIFIAGLLAMLLSLSGVIFVWKGFGSFVTKNLRFLVTFAMGVFTTTLFLMLQETVHLEASIATIAIAASLGALALEVLHRAIPEAHHHHGANKEECCEHEHEDEHGHMHTHINPRRVLLGDAAHNIGDGILIVPAFLISFHTGVAVTVGIILHELVQEISEFFILKEAGYSTRKALLSNLVVSSTIFIGIFASLLVANITSYVHMLIAFAAGGILYIIIRDLLPHTVGRIKHSGGALTHATTFVLGVVLMFGTVSVLPHSHDLHEEGDGHGHEYATEHHEHEDDHHHE